uniref:Alpha-2-macroglobulin-like 1 n=1 Tax=Oryzias latipes TaxID=8090 RepID=A0A3B3HMY1_ORYLA
MFLIPSSGYRTYLVTVSSHLTAGNKEILCALIKTPTEPASLTITLDVDSSSTKIGQLSFKTEIYRCFQFLVLSSTTVASISVKIQGKMDSLYQETKVLIEPPAFVHIVQTEKPIYKPGQTVQFRIVSMDTNFIPVNRMDPNSNRIAQWMDKSIDGGILDLSHSTIPEAAQGIYVITAETDKGETVSHNFEIKEYVLPKFEVTVNLPTVITILDDEVTLKICGKYTYGKPVLGSVRADIYLQIIMSKQSLFLLQSFFLFLQIKVTGADGSPIANQAVYLYVVDSLEFTLYTDQKGIAVFSLDTSSWSESVSLSVSGDLLQLLVAFCTKRVSCWTNNPIGRYKRSILNVQPLKNIFCCFIKKNKLNMFCIKLFKDCLCNNCIIVLGELRYTAVFLNVSPVNKGTIKIPLTNVIDLAPIAQVVVYTIVSSGEVVADSRDFPIQLCLNNKVSLKFSAVQELPGAKTTLTLRAQPSSLCSVRAIDQSVLLLKSEEELTVDYVYNQLPIKKMWEYDYQVEDDSFNPCFPRPWPRPIALEPELLPRELRDTVSHIFPLYEGDDVYTIFKVKSFTFLINFCMAAPAPEGEKTETIRTYFPETWIWDLVSVGSSGSTSLVKTVPDTITKWTAGAFCVSPAGFGVAPNVRLTAFQPFFVSLTLPYSVVRGEVFTLKATVFNYLPKCIMVKATLVKSDQFTFKNCDGCVYSSVCLCAEESKTFSWIVTPTALGDVTLKVSAEAEKSNKKCGTEVVTVPTLGQVDTVITTLLVEVKGPVSKKISLELPEDFVNGSEGASVSVVGDLMGRAMKNLDKLLAMPYGCGEQNMLLFAPNIFILDYLKSTGQLKESTQKMAVGYLESGYQRELNYKRDDGSYSAFGMGDPSGNTWLTTFVMKSFNAAKQYIFVDQKYIQDARTWLSGLQKPDGCIQSLGKLFHNGMKGGVSDDVSLTAYVAAAMLELDGNATNPVVQNCLKCLRTAVSGKITNLYTVALLSYTFTLAGDQDMRSKLITLLDQKSINEGGTRHWKRDGASETDLDSVEVEMTSYVLLALLSGPSLPGFGLDYAAGIVRWLAQQQNPFGGFSSTQDTVVALQALAKYATATFSPEGSTTVTVTSVGGLNKRFTVNKDNRLLYQEEKLTQIPGEYTIKAEGQSCVLAQISLFYNIPPPSDFSAFEISTNTRGQCDIPRPEFTLFVEGRREETNMVVINIKLLSGYILQDNSLKMLKENRLVKRVDVEEGYINIYLDGVRSFEKETFNVILEEDQQVGNLKPAVVKVYDYYQTSDEAVTDYTSPCNK